MVNHTLSRFNKTVRLKSALESVRQFLDYTSLGGVKLDGADMTAAHLHGAYFLNADLQNAFFPRANLSDAVIDQVNADRAVFTEANMSNASLCHSSFRNAVMWAVDFTGARFEDTDLRGAKLYNAKGLTIDQLKKAIIDESTLLSKDLRQALENLQTEQSVPECLLRGVGSTEPQRSVTIIKESANMNEETPIYINYLIDLIPILISTAAFITSIVSLIITIKHNRRTLTPYISFFHQGPDLKTVTRETDILFSLKNTGIGPAIISKISIATFIDGVFHVHDSWRTVGEALGFGAPFLYFGSISGCIAMQPGEERKLLWVDNEFAKKYVSDNPPSRDNEGPGRIRTPHEADKFFQHIASSLNHILVLVTFKDMYGKKTQIYWSNDPDLVSKAASHIKFKKS
jgi:hypothetical protein